MRSVIWPEARSSCVTSITTAGEVAVPTAAAQPASSGAKPATQQRDVDREERAEALAPPRRRQPAVAREPGEIQARAELEHDQAEREVDEHARLAEQRALHQPEARAARSAMPAST